MMLHAWLAQPKGWRSRVVSERDKKSAAKSTPLDNVNAFKVRGLKLTWAYDNLAHDHCNSHHTALAAPFPVAFCCKLTRLELGLITWSLQELSVVFAWTRPKGTEVLIKSLNSMQENAKLHFEIITSQSRFYWIHITLTTMVCTSG